MRIYRGLSNITKAKLGLVQSGVGQNRWWTPSLEIAIRWAVNSVPNDCFDLVLVGYLERGTIDDEQTIDAAGSRIYIQGGAYSQSIGTRAVRCQALRDRMMYNDYQHKEPPAEIRPGAC